MTLADEVETMVHAFPPHDGRRDEVRALAARIRESESALSSAREEAREAKQLVITRTATKELEIADLHEALAASESSARRLRETVEAYAKSCRAFREPSAGSYLRGRYDASLAVADELDAILARAALGSSPVVGGDEAQRLRNGLLAVETHHAGMCDAAGRPHHNSMTLRIVRAALAGCDHLAGDVCRKCHPSVPICARHPDADLRRFGPMWRCGVCGEDGTLLQSAVAAPSSREGGDEG